MVIGGDLKVENMDEQGDERVRLITANVTQSQLPTPHYLTDQSVR